MLTRNKNWAATSEAVFVRLVCFSSSHSWPEGKEHLKTFFKLTKNQTRPRCGKDSTACSDFLKSDFEGDCLISMNGCHEWHGPFFYNPFALFLCSLWSNAEISDVINDWQCFHHEKGFAIKKTISELQMSDDFPVTPSQRRKRDDSTSTVILMFKFDIFK